jgi:hypothetical protein
MQGFLKMITALTVIGRARKTTWANLEKPINHATELA